MTKRRGADVPPVRPTSPPSDAGENPPTRSEPREKVIVRSDGTVTYVGKDMAYQLWKFGLLGQGLPLPRVRDAAGVDRALWSTTSDPSVAEPAAAPPFGRASWVCNVIDTRQSYLQKLLKQALAVLGYEEQASHSIHYSYEMVALSHATARELGYDRERRAGPAVRRGVGTQGARREGRRSARSPDRQGRRRSREAQPRASGRSTARRIAEAIATAAVRYFMVKFSRGKVIVFDIDEALSFEGESGPYLQYAVVRANNIFHKLKDATGWTRPVS